MKHLSRVSLVTNDRQQGPWRTFAGMTLLLGHLLMTSAYADSTSETSPVFPTNSFALYTLSRGRGVPDAARQAMQCTRDMLEEAKQQGHVLRIVQTRIGLEGETRLCAEFTTPEAARNAWGRARHFVEGVELVNLVIEPCAKP